MTGSDDGEHDDGLRALRAVWLSLPDEDPPERGLAELMAAARVKAEEMASPPWWQRIGQLLRRPPVLALATVTVLLGGAVLIGKRGDDMHAQPPAPRSEQVAPASPAGAPVQDHALGGVAPLEQPTAEPVEAMPSAEPAPPARRPAPRASRQAPSTTAAAEQSGEDANDTMTGALRADGDKPSDNAKASVESDLRELASPRASSATSAPTSTIVPSAAQLHRDARAAAARGDCAEARTIAARISKLDATYHKTKVAPDPALAVCRQR